ncbi:hypothetical protein CTN07_20700 [Photobacterium damselae]|nr:hypothetical protein CTN07_20700 [Photobacterium damselae]
MLNDCEVKKVKSIKNAVLFGVVFYFDTTAKDENFGIVVKTIYLSICYDLVCDNLLGKYKNSREHQTRNNPPLF